MGVDQAETSVGIPGSRANQPRTRRARQMIVYKSKSALLEALRLCSGKLCDDKSLQRAHDGHLLGVQPIEIDFTAEMILDSGHQFE